MVADRNTEVLQMLMALPILIAGHSSEGHMSDARPRRSPVRRRWSLTPPTPELLFPRAVAGEDYVRYAKSVWPQAQRWLEVHWAGATRDATTVLDARLKLRAIAATDIHRHLYAQEEQLLSEIVHAAWDAAGRRSTSEGAG
jgi:hypothetical protein